jgi:hypothetical protein
MHAPSPWEEPAQSLSISHVPPGWVPPLWFSKTSLQALLSSYTPSLIEQNSGSVEAARRAARHSLALDSLNFPWVAAQPISISQLDGSSLRPASLQQGMNRAQ